MLPRDALLMEIRRALEADPSYRADELTEIERALDGRENDLWCAHFSQPASFLPRVSHALAHAFPDRAQELVAILTLACGESRAGDLRVFGLDGDAPVETERILRARSAAVFEPEIPTDALGGAYCSVFVRNGWTWPSLAVRFSCTPAEAGFHPEAILIPETSRVLIGAGESVFVYGLDSPRRIHTESAELGFMHWARQDDVIVMSAELELAAFNLDGTKRWTLFVEPPWSFDIHDGILHLDVMGTLSSFPVREGPR